MYPRKISLDQQIQDQLGISTIVLLTSIGHSSDIRRVPQQYSVSEFFEQAFKPTAVAAGFQSYYYLSGQSCVKGSQVILLVMELAKMNLSIIAAAVCKSLYPRVKVNAAIYCLNHGRLRDAVLCPP